MQSQQRAKYESLLCQAVLGFILFGFGGGFFFGGGGIRFLVFVFMLNGSRCHLKVCNGRNRLHM